MVHKYCIVNSNYTGEEGTTVFSFPKEKDLKKRWRRFANRKDWEPTSLYEKDRNNKGYHSALSKEYETCSDYIRSEKSYQ